MAITLKRRLTDDEKAHILKIHGRKCFATGHEIPDDEKIHFDHIRSFAAGGVTELDNIAPMCEPHNLQKGRLTLEDFRVKLRLKDFFDQGDTLTLRDLLIYLKTNGDISSYAQSVVAKEENNQMTIESANFKRDYPLFLCPATEWKYFYAILPVDLLDSDDDTDASIGLQPRYLIFEKVFNMYRHFQQHPVLQPSIGRLVGNHIRLFDGQHKIAALLWTGRREFECKVYWNPGIRLLNQTNIAAHDRFAQARFYSSIMVLKLGSQFGIDFEEYKGLEDNEKKSEAGFMRFLNQKDGQSVSKADRNRQFRSYLYNAVLEGTDNKLKQFVSASNRSTDEKPLTLDMLSKSLFSNFLYRTPVEDNMATESYRRHYEIANLVKFMNILYDLALNNWNPKATLNNANQRKLSRMFRSKSIMAWSELLRDAICGKLDLQDAEDRARPLYREFSDEDMNRAKLVVERLVNWKWWSAPKNDDIDRILADNKSVVKAWFKGKGLTTGYLMGAPE
ncbi:MAG: hypothetical protein GY861_25335 [bacterium]|nr:hypothetical protein [bacterium]